MIGSLVKYVSASPCSRAGQLGIVVGLDHSGEFEAMVRWLEDGKILRYLVRELEVVQGV